MDGHERAMTTAGYSEDSAAGSPGPSARIIADLRGELAAVTPRSLNRLRFSRRLERQFQNDSRAGRTREMLIGGIVSVLCYQLFLLADYLMVADVWPLALLVRLGIVTPIAVAALTVLWLDPPVALREVMAAGVTLLGVASVVLICRTSASPYAVHAQYGNILVIFFGTLVLRTQFWFALPAVAGCVLLGTLGLFGAAAVPGELLPWIFLLLLSAGLFTLVVNHQLEHHGRSLYLQQLRERLRVLELRESNRELQELSHLDPLTGVASRRAFAAALQQAWAEALAQGHPLGAIMVDVDSFKAFIDRYGHLAADDCLRRVAAVLHQQLRAGSAVLARMGEAEFAAVLPGLDQPATIQVAERMRRAVETLAITHAGAKAGRVVTVSIGVAAVQPQSEAQDPVQLFGPADAALYRSKQAGRNCVWPPADAAAPSGGWPSHLETA